MTRQDVPSHAVVGADEPPQRIIDEALGGVTTLLIPLRDAHRRELGDVTPEVAAATLPPLVRAVIDRWANASPPNLERAEREASRAALGYRTVR